MQSTNFRVDAEKCDGRHTVAGTCAIWNQRNSRETATVCACEHSDQ
jgi:hypothetical protein